MLIHNIKYKNTPCPTLSEALLHNQAMAYSGATQHFFLPGPLLGLGHGDLTGSVAVREGAVALLVPPPFSVVVGQGSSSQWLCSPPPAPPPLHTHPRPPPPTHTHSPQSRDMALLPRRVLLLRNPPAGRLGLLLLLLLGVQPAAALG